MCSLIDTGSPPQALVPDGYYDGTHAALPEPPGPAPVLVCLLPLPLSVTSDVTRVLCLLPESAPCLSLVASWAVRVLGNGDRTPSEVGSQGREMEPKGPPLLWGKGQGWSSTVLFMLVLHTLLCVISLMFLVLCPSLSGFEIQKVVGVPVPLTPSPVVRE